MLELKNGNNLAKNKHFFYVGPPKEYIFFDPIYVWSIFQSSTHILQITIFHLLFVILIFTDNCCVFQILNGGLCVPFAGQNNIFHLFSSVPVFSHLIQEKEEKEHKKGKYSKKGANHIYNNFTFWSYSHGEVHRCGNIYNNFTFRSYSHEEFRRCGNIFYFFGQVIHVDVCRCQFFCHVHRFQSCSFGQVYIPRSISN